MGELKIFECCICGCKCKGWGNSPDGAVWYDEEHNLVLGEFKPEDRCCDECNTTYVIPGRLYRLRQNKKEND